MQTGTWIDVGFERKWLLLPIYVLCEIDLDLYIDTNDTDEPYLEVIIPIPSIWICSLLKYESVPHNEMINILE